MTYRNTITRPLLFIRSLIFFIGQALATIIIASIGICLFFMPFSFRYWWITRWSHFIIWWAKITCGIHYIVEGIEHLPDEPAVIVANHQSAWETLFFQTLLPPQSWVLKRELLKIPFFGWALALLEPIAIDRSKRGAIKQLQEKGARRLSAGRWVIIFPEGTRTQPGEKRNFSRSGSLLATQAQRKLIPIAHNAGLCWPKNSFIKHPGTIKVVIGQPLDPMLLPADELHAKTEHWIKSRAESLLN